MRTSYIYYIYYIYILYIIKDPPFVYPNSSLSAATLSVLIGGQFSPAERKIMDSCNRDFRQVPALLNLKESLATIFQTQSETIYKLGTEDGSVVLPDGNRCPKIRAMLVVHRRLLDVETGCPLLDISYCLFEEESMVKDFLTEWGPFRKKGSQVI